MLASCRAAVRGAGRYQHAGHSPPPADSEHGFTIIRESELMTEQGSGSLPTGDEDFFAAVGKVFEQFPDAAGRYALASRLEPADSADGPRTGSSGGLRRVEDSLVLEFFEEQPPPGASHCFQWGRDPETDELRCLVWWLNP
jgi:hypothetical protein